MPEGLFSPKLLIGIAVLVIIAGSLGWLLDHPAVLVLIVAAISGSVFFWVRQKRARNRV